MACCLVREAPTPEPTPAPIRAEQRDHTSFAISLAKVLPCESDADFEIRFARADDLAELNANETSL